MEKIVANSKESIKELIANTLGVSLEVIQDELAIGDIPEWDSLGHMKLITALESELGISLDIEQVLEIEDVEDIIDAVISEG